MTSGKAAKRRRRELAEAQRRAEETRRGKASPKVLLAGAIAVAVMLAVLVALVSLAGGSEEQAAPTATPTGATETVTGATETAQLLRRIPQSGAVLGRPSAPVTVVEYLDLQCPFCRDFVVEAFPTLVQQYVRTGDVRVQLRGLAFLGPDSERGMKAAQAAGLQNRMFHFVDLLYRNQGTENSGWLSDETVRATAGSIPGLNVQRLLSDAGSSAVSDKLTADNEQARVDDVRATPTILVGPTGGELEKVELASATDFAAVEQAIDAAGS
jgi:protein-disulfide isomerase